MPSVESFNYIYVVVVAQANIPLLTRWMLSNLWEGQLKLNIIINKNKYLMILYIINLLHCNS